MEEKHRQLLCNRLQCPDGTIIQSKHSYDSVTHLQEDGRQYSIDGGISYIRVSSADKQYKNISLYYGDPHEEVRKYFYWGSRGKYNNLPLRWTPLKDLEDMHLLALMDYTKDYADIPEIHLVFVDEWKYRKEHDNVQT